MRPHEGIAARLRLLLAAALGALACARSAVPQTPVATAPGHGPARPAACREVSPGEDLNGLLSSGKEGEAFCLRPGVYPGPLTFAPGITLWGPPEAIVRSTGEGSTLLLASRARLLGLTVDGSGSRFDVLDAAIKLDKGEDAVIDGVTIDHALFGILLNQTRRVQVLHNHVRGRGGAALGLRGDGIHLWETYDSLVAGNLVEDTRDLVVWYSSRNRLEDNEVRGGRYGTHFMYSHDNSLRRCRYLDNEVGVFVMYSRGLLLEDNVMRGASGAAGMGLGIKESGNLTVKKNRMVHDTIGIFLDNSPLNLGDKNLFEDNLLQLGDVGVAFLSTTHDNAFIANAFRDNRAPVRVESGGDAVGLVWERNEFDDYAGYDLDGDGVGDVPYEYSDLSSALESQNASLAFLRGTPAHALVSLAGHAVPLFAPRPLLRDPHPAVRRLEK
jgi:nitrous oxidase accessory protein